MTGYQLTKAFYAEVEQNEAMQVGCKAHHHSLFTWICELRNRTGHEVLDLPVNYTMKMAFIGSAHTLGKAIEELAQWGLIEILLKTQGRNTKIKLAIAFLQKHIKNEESDKAVIANMQLQKCNSEDETEDLDKPQLQMCKSDGENEGAIAEMQMHKCNSGEENESFLPDRNCINAKRVQITKTNKTKIEKEISLGGESKNEGAALDESEENVSSEAEPSVEEPKTPPLPPRAPAGQRNADQSAAAGLPGNVMRGNESPVASPARSSGKGKTAKPEPGQETAPAKQPYRDNVTLSESEYDTLRQKHGPDFTERCLDKLSSYKLAHGKDYKSDYGAINQWVTIAVTKDDSMATGALSGNSPTPKSSTTAPMPTHQTKIR